LGSPLTIDGSTGTNTAPGNPTGFITGVAINASIAFAFLYGVSLAASIALSVSAHQQGGSITFPG
jgi:hypothetical protein